MTFEKVAEILAEYKDIEASTITPQTTFEELELDSLDMVELVMSMEDEFDVSIEMDEAIKSVQDIITLIEQNK